MKKGADRPFGYWSSLAMGRFEDDLYRLMDQLGMTRADLAEATGTSRANISQLLNAGTKNPQLKTLIKLARALDAYVQVRMMRDGEEVLRIMDVDTAIDFDRATGALTANSLRVGPGDEAGCRILQFKTSMAAAVAIDESSKPWQTTSGQ